eukprot:scaffold1172_cov115-Cylindrotheca_fusiformis.AAC.13
MADDRSPIKNQRRQPPNRMVVHRACLFFLQFSSHSPSISRLISGVEISSRSMIPILKGLRQRPKPSRRRLHTTKLMTTIVAFLLLPIAVAFQPPSSSLFFVPTHDASFSKGKMRLRSREQDIIEWRERGMDSDFFDVTDRNDLRYSYPFSETLIGIESSLRWIPAVIPILAYVMYDPTAACFAAMLEAIANNNFVVVDGGQYQAKIIAPAINGVVVPVLLGNLIHVLWSAISILFANLIGTTITTLRQRQLDIRTAINMEASQLRILQSLLDVVPDAEEQHICWKYLAQYTSRLIAESQPTISINSLKGSLDTELNGVLRSLNRLAVLTENPELADGPIPSKLVVDKAYQACAKLYEERARRITSLRSTFPILHFVIVGTLAVSICVAFLLESNQDLLMFLNAIQLRVLWTMLVGTFSALAIVSYDLGHPFRGSYQISIAVDQLYTIRLALRASMMSDMDILEGSEESLLIYDSTTVA